MIQGTFSTLSPAVRQIYRTKFPPVGFIQSRTVLLMRRKSNPITPHETCLELFWSKFSCIELCIFCGLHFDFVLSPVFNYKALALSFTFAVENVKNLPLALCTRENNWARLVGKSRYFLAPGDVEISNWSAHNPFDDMLSVEKFDCSVRRWILKYPYYRTLYLLSFRQRLLK